MSTDPNRLWLTYHDSTGNGVAWKVRDSKHPKGRWEGDPKKARLFGMQRCAQKGTLTVTEGEIDAMTVSQIQDHKWPVISIKNGASGAAKDVRDHLEWFEAFERVVFMFDGDEPGRKAAEECAALLTPGKAAIARLPDGEDPNSLLVANRSAEVVKAFWSAETWRPEGIVSFEDLEEEMKTFEVPEGYRWWHPGLHEATAGFRPGDLVVVTAAPKAGKTEFTREQEVYSAVEQGLKVGVIRLEEPKWRSFIGDVGILMNKRLTLSGDYKDDPKYLEACEKLRGRLFYFDHFGSVSPDTLLPKINYMAVGLGCQVIILDHVSIAISGLETADERKALDVLLTRLKSCGIRNHVAIIAIAHIKKADSKQKDHSEGGKIHMKDLRGTSGYSQLCDCLVALERDQQSPKNRHYTTVRVLADRWTGNTGVAGHCYYEEDTGRLRSVEAVPDWEGDF